MNPHPRLELDQRIHSPVRFSLLSLLCSVDEIEFGSARDVLGVSDSTLSQAVTVLERAGFAKSSRRRALAPGRVWLAATKAGDLALQKHMKILHQISGL